MQSVCKLLWLDPQTASTLAKNLAKQYTNGNYFHSVLNDTALAEDQMQRSHLEPAAPSLNHGQADLRYVRTEY